MQRTLTVQPGVPTLLTEFAGGPDRPLTVISPTVGAPIVWLSADGAGSISTGSPLAGGSSQQWRKPGALFAYIPTGTTPATITVSDELDTWQAPALAASPSVDQWSAGAYVPPAGMTPPSNTGIQLATAGTAYPLTDVTPAGQAWGTVLCAVALQVMAAPGSSNGNGDTVTVSLVTTAAGVATYTVQLATFTDTSGQATVSYSAQSQLVIPRLPYRIVAVGTAGSGYRLGSRYLDGTVTLAPTS